MEFRSGLLENMEGVKTMNWKNKNVFITGGDGFVGGWLVKKMVELDANVIILVRDIKKDLPVYC